MHPFSFNTAPGLHHEIVPGPVGPVETLIHIPSDSPAPYLAILGHPHPLQGGTMHNKVVTTLARACQDCNIPTLRCNFRGVGASFGTYDAGIGESIDLLALTQQWQACWPTHRVIFAGFSFGSYVAYRAAAQYPHALLLTIAPSVHHYDYTSFHPRPYPWVIFQGERDDIVPEPLVTNFAAQQHPPLEVIQFQETGHFFHKKLLELRTQTINTLRHYLP